MPMEVTALPSLLASVFHFPVQPSSDHLSQQRLRGMAQHSPGAVLPGSFLQGRGRKPTHFPFCLQVPCRTMVFGHPSSSGPDGGSEYQALSSPGAASHFKEGAAPRREVAWGSWER